MTDTKSDSKQSPTTDTESVKSTTDSKKKKPKKKGPIRFEAIGPFVIVVALIWAYFFFFFDSHVRKGIEFIGTQANGAEVNVGYVHSSFWKASLDIGKIQVTSAEEPSKNKIQIGSMHWKMLWDALLRGKVVVNEASILDIALGAPRSRPGRVLPPPPPPVDDGKPSAVAKLKDEALKRAEAEFKKNILGDAASMLSGTDPVAQLKGLEANLKSSVRIKELQADLDKKQKEWKERLDRLPQAKDIAALQDKIKKVKLDKFNNPAEVQQSLQQLDGIFKEADAKIKEVQATHQALTGDVGTYQNSLKDLQSMVDKDIKELEGHLKLPKLDAQSISSTLFGPTILSKVKQGEFYISKAREYMPPKKSKEEKKAFVPTPHEREKGRNYKFGRPNSYPLFWLKLAKISSKATPGAEMSGNLVGALENVTNDQELINQPTTASFKGDFPGQGFYGVEGKLTFDHRTENPVEKLDLAIGAFPMADRALVDSADVKIGINGAAGSTTLNAEVSGDAIRIASVTNIEKSKNSAASATTSTSSDKVAPGAPTGATGVGSFLTSSSTQPIVADILKGALADILKVNLKAGIGGKWTDPKFDIESSLGRDLSAAFEKQFQAKLNEAKAKLQSFINDNIGKQREQLMAEFNKQKAMVEGLLKEKEAEVNKAKGSVEQAKNDAVKGQSKKLEDQGKKAVEDLKKKFGF